MSVTISTEDVRAVVKYRVRRIEIIAEYESDILDRTILLEVEKVVILPGVITHAFVRNIVRTIRDIATLIDPTGTTAMQAMNMLLWDNDVQAKAVWDEEERLRAEALLVLEAPVEVIP